MMTLELTKTEFNRLRNQISLVKAKSCSHPYRTSLEREAEILRALKEHKSRGEIKRELNTSYEVINRVRKAHELDVWWSK